MGNLFHEVCQHRINQFCWKMIFQQVVFDKSCIFFEQISIWTYVESTIRHPYDLLLSKLKAYGTDKNSLDLLQSYLFGRKQRVKLNSKYSFYVTIDRGIPQGSILVPLLFNIFLNNLLLDFKTTEICNFADDNICISAKSKLKVFDKEFENTLH